MSLNCKAGDLAIIVSGKFIDATLIGKIIRVTEISRTFPSVCWAYEGKRLYTALGEVLGVADSKLRPIRGEPSTSVTQREEETA